MYQQFSSLQKLCQYQICQKKYSQELNNFHSPLEIHQKPLRACEACFPQVHFNLKKDTIFPYTDYVMFRFKAQRSVFQVNSNLLSSLSKNSDSFAVISFLFVKVLDSSVILST